MQGRYGNNEDNLELIARVGDRLAHFYRNSGQFDWTFNGWLPGSGYSGSPSLVQGRIGEEERNMELVVPMADRGFAFLWRNGDIEGQFPWSEPLIVGRDFGHIDSISLVQSTFGENQNNIEALMRVGDRLAYVWRDSVRAADLDGGWRGPESLELFYQGERIDAPEVDIDLPQSELRKLKVTFESLYAHNSHDDRGEAHWDLIGSVNGKPVELMNDYLVPADVDLPLNVRPDTPKSVEVIIPKGQYFVLEANGRERDHTADGGDKSAFRTWFEKGDAALDTYLNEKYKDKLTAEQVANLTKAEKDLAIWNEISTELRSSDNSWVKTLGESGHAGLETYKIFYSSWIPGWGKLLAVGFAIYDFIDIVADLNPDDGLGAIRITCSPINDFCMGTHSISSQHNGNDDDSVNDYDLTFRVEEAAFTEEDFKKTTVSNNNNDDPNTSTTTMTVRAGEEIINLQVVSTSEISDFSLDEARKAISFKVDGTNGTPGFTTIPISKVLEGDYVVMIDGETTTNFATSPNEETGNTDMKISYTHSVHDITIIGTKVNPEFPFAALLAAIGIASIIAFTSRGRLSLGRRRQ